ncbi:hypothetical protein FDECE_4894 [Fusarium decemcellulare]|nr:hypothetical protein FDECE_4894 [Fusarium decemcellulare]
MSKSTPPPRGVLVPAPTFFKKDGELDLETQGAHGLYLAKSGIKGVVVLGSTGEGVHVHPRERIAIIKAVRERLNAEGHKDFLVIAGTATHNIEETLEQLRDAKEAGAAYGQSLVPGYNAAVTPDAGLVNWYTAVADKSPLPIIIYNYPGVSNGLHIKASGLSKLAQHPNIVGAKLSHGDVSLITQLSEQEVTERKKIQYRVSRMTELVVKHGVPGIKEATSRMRGFGQIGGTRLPLLGGIVGGDAEWSNWETIFADVEEIEKSL